MGDCELKVKSGLTGIAHASRAHAGPGAAASAFPRKSAETAERHMSSPTARISAQTCHTHRKGTALPPEWRFGATTLVMRSPGIIWIRLCMAKKWPLQRPIRQAIAKPPGAGCIGMGRCSTISAAFSGTILGLSLWPTSHFSLGIRIASSTNSEKAFTLKRAG